MTEAADSGERPVYSHIVGVIAAAVLLGAITSRPSPTSFVVAAEAYQIRFQWPCEGAYTWALPSATVLDLSNPEDTAIAVQDARLVIDRGSNVLLRQRSPGRYDILIAPMPDMAASGSPVGRIEFPAPAAAEEGSQDSAIPVGEAGLLVQANLAEDTLTLLATGLFTLGGVVQESSANPDVLVSATIRGRDTPWFSPQGVTFLDETVEMGSLIVSHPERDDGQGAVSTPAGGWQAWCASAPDGNTPYASAAVRLNPASADDAAGMAISMFRRSEAIGLRTLGGIVAGGGTLQPLSVSAWQKAFASSAMQTAIVVAGALLTLLGTLYDGFGRRLFGPLSPFGRAWAWVTGSAPARENPP